MTAFLSIKLADAASRHSKIRDWKVFLFCYLPVDCLNLGFIPPAETATKKTPEETRSHLTWLLMIQQDWVLPLEFS